MPEVPIYVVVVYYNDSSRDPLVLANTSLSDLSDMLCNTGYLENSRKEDVNPFDQMLKDIRAFDLKPEYDISFIKSIRLFNRPIIV
jgi:hypothetical protein